MVRKINEALIIRVAGDDKDALIRAAKEIENRPGGEWMTRCCNHMKRKPGEIMEIVHRVANWDRRKNLVAFKQVAYQWSINRSALGNEIVK